MESLGIWLSNARQEKGLSLQKAAQTTCIRLRYLEMLEAGNTAALPDGPVQVRGFLAIYARYLGLPVEQVLAQYEAETAGRAYAAPAVTALQLAPSVPSYSPDVSSSPSSPEPFLGSHGKIRAWVSRVVLIGASLLILTGLVSAGYFISRRTGGKATAQADAGAPLATLVPATATTLPAESVHVVATAASKTEQSGAGGVVTIGLEATEHVWVRVTQDGQQVFDGFMAPGEMATYSGKSSVVVMTGNGAGLLVTVDGHSEGAMGARGEVCERDWGPGGSVIAE